MIVEKPGVIPKKHADIRFANIQYGFEYGSAKVTRLFSDKEKGWVTLGIRTPKYEREIQIYITRTGKVRIHDSNGEWMPPKKQK